ncbi:MAG: 16S rRNA (guanine(527)-N(7))-methyltransferase RsmG [Flavobacteriaceae bacterium]|nr:16S rRNA (guanine(527)-N(7))-methyltransferase RsmG [Flavobacteriaceae bacterium]|tara:strand:+ start:4982 stop:5599 length:618 start_codon:yes stop_codon:yes gene_type:complete
MKIILDKFPDLSEKQISQFSKLKDLYTYWNDKINVISRKDIENIYLRHILHSLAIAKFINFKNGTTVLDLGTGGGFPGIPLSIIFPNTNFILSDSIKKKILVVNEVVKQLGLENVKSEWSRAENLNHKYDFLVTRAVAKMPKIIEWSKGNFNPISINDISNGIIALKGGDVTEELLGIEQKKIVDIKNFFDNHYFIDKKIVYVSS